MNILCGCASLKSIYILDRYNIKNIYVGFYDEESEKKWPITFFTVNKRGSYSNFFGEENFIRLNEEALKRNISVYVTFNSQYKKAQMDWLLKAIKFVSIFPSVKGIIVGDINLLLKLKEIGYNKTITISTIGNVFNDYAIEFYTSLGATRFVFDRQTTAKEILCFLNKYPMYEYEIFLQLGIGCSFIDGYCNNIYINNSPFCGSFTTRASYKCNLCLLYYLKNYTNVSFKLNNRGSKVLAQGLSLVKLLERILNKNIDFNGFRQLCKKILKKYRNVECNPNICSCRDLNE